MCIRDRCTGRIIKMDAKYLKKKALILAHLRIDSFDCFLLKLEEVAGSKEISVLKQKCEEAEIVDFTGNGINNEVFSKIFASYPFISTTELYLVLYIHHIGCECVDDYSRGSEGNAKFTHTRTYQEQNIQLRYDKARSQIKE
eukprot:TRINITY_DN13361_c0_g1_i11.p1 TRINITY_DN13361_c0_g1~~TRINITY_DN13361_c0_g1_i11.p1  ORF type:complete len:142 (-),score=6.23 TRINITY_DN13361_c0_g1_i11:494-919(-)